MKMTTSLVSLLCFVLVSSAWGAFPGIGNPLAFGFHNPFGINNPMLGRFGGNNVNNDELVNPNMLTCINADSNDYQSQVRLTFLPVQNQANGLGNVPHGMAAHPFLGGRLGLGLGGLSMQGSGRDRKRTWHVQGVVTPGQIPKTGSYQVAVFRGGRTFGRCQPSALGEVVDSDDNNRAAFPFGPVNPLMGRLGINPFGAYFGGPQHARRRSGMLSNAAVLGTGTTMFAAFIEDMSYNDLVGHSLAMCQSTVGDRCSGRIAHCCSIVSDALPADQIFIEPTVPTQPNIQFGVAQAGVGVPAGAVGVPGGVMGIPTVPVGGVPNGLDTTNVINVDDSNIGGLF